MKLFHDTNSFLLSLVILAELLVHSSSSHPTLTSPLCGRFRSMIHQVERLINTSKKLHGLKEDGLHKFMAFEDRLDGLPVLQHTPTYFSSPKVNESLSQLCGYTASFGLHASWLKTAQENVSVPSQAAEGASNHLKHLSELIVASLDQISEKVPEAAPSSLPVVSSAFDALRFSVEISERLQAFCFWSKRLLLQLQKQSHCRKH